MSNEPVVWMVYTQDGQSCYVTNNPADISPVQRALPLYTQPFPTDEALLRQALEALESSDWYIGQLERIIYNPDDTGTHEERAKVQSTIADLRERLGEEE